MLKQLLHLPRGVNADCFVCTTRAGMKIGCLFTPGISGSALFIAALILTLKGYRVRWLQAFDMPSNWMSLHPGFKEKNARAIINRTEVKADMFAEKILAGKNHLLHGNSISECIWGVILFPISVPYIFLGRFGLAKIFFSNSNCNGCGACARNCPVGAIKMKGTTNPRPFWTLKCESCMRCMGYCPLQAVEAYQPLVAAYYYASVPAAAAATAVLVSFCPPVAGGGAVAIYYLISIAFYFLSIIIFYYAFYLLSRFRIFNALFSYTTLTHFYRRYHEPDTRERDMQ